MSRARSRWLGLAVFLFSLVAGAETGRYRYAELVASASGPYAPYLAEHGIAQHAFVVYFMATEALVAVAFAVTGLFIALRGPTTRMAFFAAAVLMLYGVTIPPPMHAVVVNAPPLPEWLGIERSVAIGLFVVFVYLFPDGRTTWLTRTLSAIVIVWTALWRIVPATNPYRFPHPWPFIVIATLFASGVAVQLWFHRARSPLQRQQTKWVVYAVTASVAGDFFAHLPWEVAHLRSGPDLIVLLVHQPFFVAFQLAVPIAIGFSALYYHLWEIDFIVSRTVLYAAIMTSAAVLWEAVNLTTTALIQRAMGPQAGTFAGGTATIVTGLFLKPMYEGLKRRVDKRLTPPTLDLSDEFPEFRPDVRTRLNETKIVDALITHLPLLFDLDDCAVYLAQDGVLTPRAVRGSAWTDGASLEPDGSALQTLRTGAAARLGAEPESPALVPIVLPRAKHPDLLGVLALGRRRGEKGYSQLEISALEDLGRQAGMALYVTDARR